MARGRDHSIDPERRRIHRATRRSGPRQAKWQRMATAEDVKRFALGFREQATQPHQAHTDRATGPIPQKPVPKPSKPGFFRRMFQRKTGG
jgi:hypothetical protein